MKKILLAGLFIMLSNVSFAQKTEEIKMFPQPDNNQNQKVIFLDEMKNEEDYMVEIMICKKTMTDGCNNYFLLGTLETKDLKGWGYNYYEFNTNGESIMTLMGCLNPKPEEKIVYAESLKVRYNSRLPIVIYTPKEYEVNYRIWKAESEIHQAR